MFINYCASWKVYFTRWSAGVAKLTCAKLCDCYGNIYCESVKITVLSSLENELMTIPKPVAFIL